MSTPVARGAAALLIIACGGSTAGAPADGGADAVPQAPLGEQVAISSVELFQTVKLHLGKDGVPIAENAPVVTGRPGLLRVYLAGATKAKWRARKLEATLYLMTKNGDTLSRTDAKSIAVASRDDALGSTLNFALAAEDVADGTTYRIVVRAPDATDELSYPADGTNDSLRARPGGEEIMLRLVPVQYLADGNDRLPDTSDSQIALYRDTIYRMYPTAKVSVSVRSPFPWTRTVSPDGTGWDELLIGVANLRVSDNLPDQVYDIAAFEPASSLGKFCSGGGCVLGVAPLADQADVFGRVAMVLGYSGQVAANTLLQELAHAMGRGHADCGGAAGPDPKFPYPQAGIGNWGYDILSSALVDPDAHFDFMGYCQPNWISDYTYAGLFKRVAYVRKTTTGKSYVGNGAPAASNVFRTLRVPGDGKARWLSRTVRIPSTSDGATKVVEFIDGAGQTMGTAAVLVQELDHLPGAQVFVPPRFWGARSVRYAGEALAIDL